MEFQFAFQGQSLLEGQGLLQLPVDSRRRSSGVGGLVWGQGIVSEHMKMAYRAPWRLCLS